MGEAEQTVEADLGVHLRRRLRPNTAVALVDFDNWFRATPAAAIEPVLIHCINEVTRELLESTPEVEYVAVRLYGGWIENGTLTALASEVAAAAGQSNSFPRPSLSGDRVIHGDVVLARHLSIAPHIDLGDSSRRRTGPPRLRLSALPLPSICLADASTCPAKILQRFTKAPSKSCLASLCPVTAETAFTTREQKMVDTLMACDLLDLSHDEDVVAIAVVTADADLLPPIIHARSLHKSKLMLITNLPYWTSEQIELIEQIGISYSGPRQGTQ